MKKLIFTLMMMAGLALVTGTAMAENETEVLPGNQYSYSLSNIVLTEEATAFVEFEGTNSGNVTIYQADGTTSFPVAGLTMADTETSLNFEILYAATGTDNSATDDSIKVTITYNGTSSTCSNIIKYGIDILPPPTYTLAIAVDKTSTCQERTGTGHNLADARGTESNTITFTVTPTIENIPTDADFTFTYNITSNINTSLLNAIEFTQTLGNQSTTVNDFASGTYNTDENFVLTFNTTTGISTEVIEAVLNDITTTATLVVNDGSTTQATIYATGTTTTASTTISAVPTMGSFAN